MKGTINVKGSLENAQGLKLGKDSRIGGRQNHEKSILTSLADEVNFIDR